MVEENGHLIVISHHDPAVARRIRDILGERGIPAQLLSGIEELGHHLLGEECDLVILSGGLRDEPVRKILKKFRRSSFRGAVIGFWESGSMEEEERLEQLGVDEVLTKPPDPREVFLVSKRLLEREDLIQLTGLIGTSRVMTELLEKVERFAPVNSTVLITGESGTGKELVAKALHRLSPRSHKPFIAVNCAALPESLLESELFGHEKGAFTGATALRKGRFEIAHGGTLFLDEIGEMSLSTQVHLLRVLEERELMRVGGSTPIPVDVRVVVATNRDIREEVSAGRFRRDLYYRIKVLMIDVPPLRERREDIPLLVNKFVREFCEENRRSFAGLTDEALEVLVNYDWPGNVRELRNLIESMLVLSPDHKIKPSDIPEHIFKRGDPRRLLPMQVLPEIPEGRRFEAILNALLEIKHDVDEIKEAMPVRKAGEVVPESEDREFPGGEPRYREGDGYIKIVPGTPLEEVEKILIEATLDMVGGNRRMASELLGIGERTLYRKIKNHQLT